MGERSGDDDDVFFEAMMSLNIRPGAKDGGPVTRAKRPSGQPAPPPPERVNLEDEDALFEAAMADAGRAESAPRRAEPDPAAAAPAPTPARDFAGDDALFEKAMTALDPPPAAPDPEGPQGREMAVRLTGTPRSLRRRIKNGEIEAALELDLHGHRRDEAKAALERFVKGAVEGGAEVARIITGRGLRSAERAILKEAVPQWLGTELKAWVHLVVGAPQSHGGEGVIYVFFRRFRAPSE